MIKDITVEASTREARGKNEARRLRQQGRVPAVLYGGGKDSVPVSVVTKQLSQILQSATGHNTIFQVALGDGAREAAMLVDWQMDPLRGDLLHADLQRIDLTKSLKVKVPIATHGEAKGVKTQGGLLEIVAREVEVECLPNNIPEHIVVDIADLGIGDAFRVKNIPATEKYRVVDDPEKILVHVIVLRVEEEKPAEAVAEAAAAPAEPEVIKKGKQVEEGEEKEAAPKEKEPKEGKGKK